MYTNRPLKIVLIDDDPQMREMLKDFFTGKYVSSDVSTYSTGEEAISTLSSEPNLIVLDYHLDSADAVAMNGLQVLKKIKERFPNVPVIFLSGQEKAEVAANTMKYGAYDYIVKNESAFHRLEILINNILGHVELKKNLGTQKFFNTLLGILVAALIIGILVMRMKN
jgi:two-component system, OmpR family, response regulator